MAMTLCPLISSVLSALPPRYDSTTRAELEAGICANAGLAEGTKFVLEDEDGDAIVLSASIPNGERLMLKVTEPMGKKKRRHSGGSAGGRSASPKKLRSNTQTGAFRSGEQPAAAAAAAPLCTAPAPPPPLSLTGVRFCDARSQVGCRGDGIQTRPG